MRTTIFGVVLLLAGPACTGGLSQYNPDGFFGLGTEGTDGTDGTDGSSGFGSEDKAAVDDVYPNHGSTVGGTEVTILGGPFESNAIVWFGDTQAWVSSFSEYELIVDSPPQLDGVVNVVVEQSGKRSKMADAFRYWEDGSGKAGVLGQVSWYRYVGNYWADDPVPYGFASLFFITPASLQYWELFAPTMDSCAGEDFQYNGLDVLQPDVDQFTLETTGAADIELDLSQDYMGLYLSPELTQADYAANVAYSLISDGTTAFPAFEVSAAVNVGTAVNLTTPNVNNSSPPTVRRNSFDLTWTAGDGDFVLAALYQWNASTVVETVHCVMEDDGSFRVPSDAWTGWNSGRQMSIEIGRAQRGSGELPYNNGRSEATGMNWIVGAATQK